MGGKQRIMPTHFVLAVIFAALFIIVYLTLFIEYYSRNLYF